MRLREKKNWKRRNVEPISPVLKTYPIIYLFFLPTHLPSRFFTYLPILAPHLPQPPVKACGTVDEEGKLVKEEEGRGREGTGGEVRGVA